MSWYSTLGRRIEQACLSDWSSGLVAEGKYRWLTLTPGSFNLRCWLEVEVDTVLSCMLLIWGFLNSAIAALERATLSESWSEREVLL